MRKILFMFLIALFLTSWTSVYAAPAAASTTKSAAAVTKSTAPAAKSAVKSSRVASRKTVAMNKAARPLELTTVRWANHNEALTGTAMLRLVIDATGPVEVSGTAVSAPTPRLVVTVKGTTFGKKVKNLTLDGKVVDKVAFAASGKDTKVTIDLPLAVKEGEYRVFTLPSDAKADKPFRVVIDINKPLPMPDFSFTAGLKNKVIAIDPGHGGSDPGAIGPSKYQEKIVTLAVARKVQTLLEKAGAKVIMTRKDDRDVFGAGATAVDELKARSSLANNNKADVFVSIHADAFTNPVAGGTTTYYYQKTLYDAMLASAVQTDLIDVGKLQDRQTKLANFYVLKHARMPAVLVELAFISNPKEEKLLSSPDFQQKMALGIVRGLGRFFDQAAKLH